MNNLNTKFLNEISHIKEPEIFIGLAKLLCVKLVNDDGETLDFVDILDRVLHQYSNAPRKLRKDILKMLREANKEDK